MRAALRIRLPGPHAPAWVFWESAAAAVLSLASVLLVAGMIGPEAAGVGMVALAAYHLADLVVASLFADALVQRRGLEPRHANSAVTAALAVGAAGALALGTLGPLLAAATGMPGLGWLTLALAPCLPLSAVAGAAQGLLLRARRYRLLSLRILGGQPLALAAGMAAAAAGLGAWAVVAMQAVAVLATAVLTLGLGRLELRLRLDRAALRDLWPVAGPQAAATTVNIGKYRLFLMALGAVSAEAVVAQSHLAFRMLDAALTVVWHVSTRLALPRLCTSAGGDRAALAEAYGELAELQALLGLPITVGVALVAPELVLGLLGPAWGGTADAARLVGLSTALFFAAGPYTSLFVALGQPRRNLWIAVATLVLPLAALVSFRPTTSSGVALAWSTQCVALPPLLIWMVLRELRRSPLWLARRLAPAVLATAAMMAAVLVLRRGIELPPLLEVLAAAGTGAAVYVAVAGLALGFRCPTALTPERRPDVAFGSGFGHGASGGKALGAEPSEAAVAPQRHPVERHGRFPFRRHAHTENPARSRPADDARAAWTKRPSPRRPTSSPRSRLTSAHEE